VTPEQVVSLVQLAFLDLLEDPVRLVSLAYKDNWASLVHLVLLAVLDVPALLDSLARKVLLEHLDCKAGQVSGCFVVICSMLIVKKLLLLDQ